MSVRPVALRPSLSKGLPLSNLESTDMLPFSQSHQKMFSKKIGLGDVGECGVKNCPPVGNAMT
jgi:hypothetical protein